MKLAEETDSKKADRELRVEAEETLKLLRKVCPHEICVQIQAYSPGYSSYEDSTPEVRKCLVCNEYEESDDKCKKLLTVVGRFSRNIFKSDSGLPPQISNPLNYLLAECLEVVDLQGRSLSIRWAPKK